MNPLSLSHSHTPSMLEPLKLSEAEGRVIGYTLTREALPATAPLSISRISCRLP